MKSTKREKCTNDISSMFYERVQTCARCVFMHVQLDRSQWNIGFELAFYSYYDRRFACSCCMRYFDICMLMRGMSPMPTYSVESLRDAYMYNFVHILYVNIMWYIMIWCHFAFHVNSEYRRRELLDCITNYSTVFCNEPLISKLIRVINGCIIVHNMRHPFDWTFTDEHVSDLLSTVTWSTCI